MLYKFECDLPRIEEWDFFEVSEQLYNGEGLTDDQKWIARRAAKTILELAEGAQEFLDALDEVQNEK